VGCSQIECYKWYTGPTCALCYQKSRKLLHRDHVLKLAGESAKRRRPKLREWEQKYRDRPESKMRQNNAYLKYKYGITLEDYFRMVEEQGGKCKICQREGTGRNLKGRMSVDHCHKTGRVRGLLCHPCNAALGLLQESREVLLKAIDYLEAA
jgi:Recombination endonuclease VII